MRRSTGTVLSVLTLLAAGLVAPTSALAHDSFIVAPATAIDGQPLIVQITSSSFFPEPETPIRPDRIARVLTRSGVEPLQAIPTAGDVAMQLAVSAPGPEGAVIGVSLTPWNIDVGAEEIGHYMDEIGAGPDLRASVTTAAAAGPLPETYTKHLKAIVCGTDCATVGADRALGLAMEFVVDPSTPRGFVLLQDGKPLPDLPIFVTSESAGRKALVTDAHGRVSLPADLTGPILLMAVDLEPPTETGGRFTSRWAALTFDARLLSR